MCDTWGDPPWCRKAIEPARRRDAAHLFFQLVCRRYESKSILVTSNRSLSDWGMVFGDPTVATAIGFDRQLAKFFPFVNLPPQKISRGVAKSPYRATN